MHLVACRAECSGLFEGRGWAGNGAGGINAVMGHVVGFGCITVWSRQQPVATGTTALPQQQKCLNASCRKLRRQQAKVLDGMKKEASRPSHAQNGRKACQPQKHASLMQPLHSQCPKQGSSTRNNGTYPSRLMAITDARERGYLWQACNYSHLPQKRCSQPVAAA